MTDYLGAPMHDALANIIRQLTVAWELLIKEKIVHVSFLFYFILFFIFFIFFFIAVVLFF